MFVSVQEKDGFEEVLKRYGRPITDLDSVLGTEESLEWGLERRCISPKV